MKKISIVNIKINKENILSLYGSNEDHVEKICEILLSYPMIFSPKGPLDFDEYLIKIKKNDITDLESLQKEINNCLFNENQKKLHFDNIWIENETLKIKISYN